jgi:hypothetical protein
VGVTFAPDATGFPGGTPPPLSEYDKNTMGWSGDHGWGGSPKATGGNPATWEGQAQFHIEIGQENSQLGCSVTSPCSLVVVPNFGGAWNYMPPTNQPSQTDTSHCEDHTNDDSRDADVNLGGVVYANSHVFAACQNMDRIVVPLSFAPTAANCPNGNPAFYAEGSPMMNRAMTQWQAGMCTGSAPVDLQYSFGVSEEAARSAFLQGGQSLSARTDMALTTLPPDAAAAQGSSRKFTYAPLANSGVALAYYLDDPSTGQSINHVVREGDRGREGLLAAGGRE